MIENTEKWTSPVPLFSWEIQVSCAVPSGVSWYTTDLISADRNLTGSTFLQSPERFIDRAQTELQGVLERSKAPGVEG